MAQKSKTQKAKASAARAARKEAREEALLNESTEVVEAQASKKTTPAKAEEKKTEKKAVKKAKKPNRLVQFFKDVKAEMKRVTWPTKTDVLRWSGVVVAALLFFGIYVAVLDNLIVTPILVGISGLAG